MKRLFTLLVFCLLVGAVMLILKENKKEKDVPVINTVTKEITERENKASEKMYGIWLTYSEIGSLVKGKNEGEYREAVEGVFESLKENKINTVFYQCRAFCDSFYNSEIFPVSKYITADTTPTFDPLEIFSEKASSYGVAVHCWVNPYRVSYNGDYESLPGNSPAKALYKENKNSLIICDEGVFLNPACEESRKLVLDGIREILEKYEVDGIHFDDYFYPETDDLNDKALYKEYRTNGGRLTLSGWRRENVSALVGGVFTLVKSYDDSLIFSISPSADIEKCQNIFYADVEKWCAEEGFADYIIPQMYYGFENENMPFACVAEEWENLASSGNVELICGLAPYKSGRADEFAGYGKNEWIENVNILSRQYEQVTKSKVWQGFSLFSYSYCFGDNMTQNSKKEIKKLMYMVK